MIATRPIEVVVAVPVASAVVDRLREHSGARVRWEPELLPPRRHAGDYAGDPSYRRTPSEQRRYDDLVREADVLFGIPDTDPEALRRAVEANPRLVWVHTMAAGGGSQVRDAGIDAAALERVRFTTSAGVHGGALAEFAVLGLLAGIKDQPRWTRDKARAQWPPRRPVRQLRDATVLVLGTGGVGGSVARLLRPFGARVWALRRDDAPVPDVFDRGVDVANLEAALAEVDAVVAALPDTPRTRHLVDARFLSHLPRGAILVNVGRGSVVDEAGLVDALGSGHVGFAALDVFEREPLPADSPLWRDERVLLSPHTAALDDGEEMRVAELFLDNLDRLVAGRALRNEIDRDEFY